MRTGGLIDCTHCVEDHIIPDRPPNPNPPLFAKAIVKCRGCGHTLESHAVEIGVPHHSLDGKPHATIIRIEPLSLTPPVGVLSAKAGFQVNRRLRRGGAILKSLVVLR